MLHKMNLNCNKYSPTSCGGGEGVSVPGFLRFVIKGEEGVGLVLGDCFKFVGLLETVGLWGTIGLCGFRGPTVGQIEYIS